MQQWIPAGLVLLALAAPGAAAAEATPEAQPADTTSVAADAAPAAEPTGVAAEGTPGAGGEQASPPAGPVPWPIPDEAPGDPEQQFLIGRALLLGHDEHGKPHKELRNPRAANVWFEKAAKQGYARAQVNLGISYLRGRGRFGPEKGLEWLRKASDQGHPKAHLELALLYRDGRVVRRDRVRAMMYIVLAAQRGSPAAQFMQAGFGRRLSEEDRREALRLVRVWRKEHGYPTTGPMPPMVAVGQDSEPADDAAADPAPPSAGATDAAAGDPARPAS